MKIDLNNRRHQAAIAVTVVLVALGTIWFLKQCLTEILISREPVITVTPRYPTSDQSLTGYVVVIDPGHGGTDPGAHGKFQGKEVYEAPYVMDVARRVTMLVEKNGGTVLLTRSTPGVDTPNDSPPSSVLPLTRADIFRDGSPVVTHVIGMERRLDVVRYALKNYPKSRVIWVSIHFDAESTDLHGVSVIIPAGIRPRVADTLFTSFGQAKRLRKRKQGLGWRQYNPIIVNIVRNLYILRNDKNPAREKVLVELGNFGDAGDVWRIRNPNVREQYAEAILAGIEP